MIPIMAPRTPRILAPAALIIWAAAATLFSAGLSGCVLERETTLSRAARPVPRPAAGPFEKARENADLTPQEPASERPKHALSRYLDGNLAVEFRVPCHPDRSERSNAKLLDQLKTPHPHRSRYRSLLRYDVEILTTR